MRKLTSSMNNNNLDLGFSRAAKSISHLEIWTVAWIYDTAGFMYLLCHVWNFYKNLTWSNLSQIAVT